MANGIGNLLTNKIFPAIAPGNQTENGNPKALQFSPPVTKIKADTALNHITEQFVARQTPASQTVIAKRAGDEETQKTVTDFYKEVLTQQPFDAETLAKQKVTVLLETKKPAGEMTLADYELAKDRAIFKQAGYALLTDAEIRMAVAGIKSHGAVNHGNDELDKLRGIDNQPGAMFITTDGATIEYAKRAGQAVLQYQECKAKQSDANQEEARSEVNQMFADQGRVLWNSAVNIVEGTINTAIDAALTNGGTNPIPLLNPNRPQADFSSAKFDYQSAMLRRNLHGEVDGAGLKRGTATELGVTIIAPIVVGAATVPKAAPQSLKTLGGIPEVEATVTQATARITTAAKVNQTTPTATNNSLIWKPTPSRTVPSSVKPLEPIGVAEKPIRNPKTIDEKIFANSIKRQNEAAEVLAKNGYRVEHQPKIETFTERMRNPWLDPKKKPDFKIEGEIFDAYAPGKNKTAKQVLGEIKDKVDDNQTRRVLLNLDDSKLNPTEIAKQLRVNKIQFLDEIIAVKNGKITKVYPF